MDEKDFKRLLDEQAKRLENRFDVSIERVEKRFDLLAETVEHLGEKLDRETASIRQEMRQGFAETQAMIKFSHAELDRRVRALEDGMASLQSRVERLERATN